MLLRSGRRKPYQMPPRRRQSVEKKFLLRNMRTAAGKSAFSLRETLKCYILTEDSKTVHFDIDEDGHHEICTKDSQSHEDSNNLVSLTQRSKLNEFVLLCKGKKHLSLKVLKASCSEPDGPLVERCKRKTCGHEDPDFKQLSEDNNFFIMHCEGDSVQFQCYEDRRYYLCVNDDSLDIRKLENKEPNEDKNFYFRVSLLQEK
ncbi:uncharacterized protein LOC120511943 isoform X3 [Passer montanus]|uniref:uncharacterized protein LOC120511943 isoform X3 n=1 Tax=Passer montanus TaxID=9160 RepID=UPI001961D298|nr:uncharacterized protein LOC120511943 isoform X3 [Passer montanus]